MLLTVGLHAHVFCTWSSSTDQRAKHIAEWAAELCSRTEQCGTKLAVTMLALVAHNQRATNVAHAFSGTARAPPLQVVQREFGTDSAPIRRTCTFKWISLNL